MAPATRIHIPFLALSSSPTGPLPTPLFHRSFTEVLPLFYPLLRLCPGRGRSWRTMPPERDDIGRVYWQVGSGSVGGGVPGMIDILLAFVSFL